LLVLKEKVHGNAFFIPYWILEENIENASPRKKDEKYYYCKVNKNYSITFGGERVKEKIVHPYIIQYKSEVTTRDFKVFQQKVFISIVVAGLLNSSLWALIETFFMSISIIWDYVITICFLAVSFLILFKFYYRVPIEKPKK